ncbi:MAG: hypothetical protein Kow00114_15180 [Kiloniellaceae bacterium]
MSANGQSFYVLEHKGARIQLGDDPDEVQDQLVSRVVEHAMSDKRETLARCASEDAIDRTVADSGSLPDRGTAQSFDSAGDYRGIGKVELVDGTVNRIDLDGGGDVEARLLEAEA